MEETAEAGSVYSSIFVVGSDRAVEGWEKGSNRPQRTRQCSDGVKQLRVRRVPPNRKTPSRRPLPTVNLAKNLGELEC